MANDVDIDRFGPKVARVTLNRPLAHNAFNAQTIVELQKAFLHLDQAPDVRAIVLVGAGKSFCAGADLVWMRACAAQSETENRLDALQMAGLYQTINACSKPVIALVQGAALGGGVGLCACCDIVVATEGAQFALTEVRLGLIPAVISPYVVNKIGSSAARRYMITGERFNAHEAHRLGLVHAINDDLVAAVKPILEALLLGAPGAIADIKSLMMVKDVTIEETAARIAARRASHEGREGMSAFLERRQPMWSSSDEAQ